MSVPGISAAKSVEFADLLAVLAAHGLLDEAKGALLELLGTSYLSHIIKDIEFRRNRAVREERKLQGELSESESEGVEGEGEGESDEEDAASA